MKQPHTRAEILANKLLSRTITTAEEQELNQWYAHNLDAEINIPPDFASSEQQQYDRIQSAIRSHIHQKPLILWPKIAIAAAVASILFGIWFYTSRHSAFDRYPEFISGYQDIAAGKQGATLTLANGKKIKLSAAANGELAKQAGIRITKTTGGQIIYELDSQSPLAAKDNEAISYNTLTTSKGETYMVILPDKSKVWLNAASSLKYPTRFEKSKSRHVSLTGEGYFEIAKDKAHPFIVSTETQSVQVLGTHFNINAYANESSTQTTLLEGSVKVSSSSLRGGTPKQSTPQHWIASEATQPRNEGLTSNDVLLKPGQQAMLHAGKFKVEPADTDEILAWKNGEFIFNDEGIESIMKRVARWYDVEVVYDGDIPKARFNGVISRNKNISEVLRVLQKTRGVQFKVEGRRITVEE